MHPEALEIDFLTLFPSMLDGFLNESILRRAQDRGLVKMKTYQLRDWASGSYQQVDDRPFGGGSGMVLMPEPLFQALDALNSEEAQVVFLTPDGEALSPQISRELAASSKRLIFLSGHYEGIDQRVRDTRVDREISIGDYVITNGTLAAAVLADSVIRQIPGVLGDENSLTDESFEDKMLDFPQYTRPVECRGLKVPEVLLSGNHEAIRAWRLEQRLAKTRERRPDLLTD